MNGNEEYVFCPECGALMKDGVCLSCKTGKKEMDAIAAGSSGGEAGREGFEQRLQQEYDKTSETQDWGADRPSEQSGLNEVQTAFAVPNQKTLDDQNDRDQSQSGGGIRWDRSQLGSWDQSQAGIQNGWNQPAGGDGGNVSLTVGQNGGNQEQREDGIRNQGQLDGSGWNQAQPAGQNVGNQNQPDGGSWNQGQPVVRNAQNQPVGQNSWNQNQPGGQNSWNQNQPGGQNSWNQGQPSGQNSWNQSQPVGQNAWNQNYAGAYGAQNQNRPGVYQNWNYGQPGDYGAWNGRQPGYGQPGQGIPAGQGERRNSHRAVAAVVAAVIAVLLCVVMILLFFIVKNSVQDSGGLVGNKDYFFSDPPEERQSGEDDEWRDGIFDSLPEEDEEYIPSAEDEYYVKLADSLRDDLDYTIKWEEYDNVDETTGATAVGRYPQIEGGNIPHLDELNAFVKEEATYYSNLYGYYREWGDATLYASESMGYVTYMDEEKISIVLQESIATEDGSNIALYSINIDLMSGEIMNNGGIIEYSEELTQAFRDQNDYQNGYVRAVDVMSDEKLQDFLSDEDTNIVFFTPVGLEIGFNYTTSDSSGWVTATIRDYDRYRKKF